MEEANEGIERVIQKLRNEVPLRKCDAMIYAARAREYCKEIQRMRNDGFSYLQICRAFEEERLLPENSNVDSFRQACRRAFIKQGKHKDLAVAKKEAPEPVTGKAPEGPPKKEEARREVATQTAEALERERRKKLGLDKPIYTGTGRIIKHADGSFDFD